MGDFEKLGAFYLGRVVDPATGQPTHEDILYDAKDLTTHALCVGMTGSGKTGLCLSLIEEAAIDGIPVLAIDPKGDLGNLMLTFPDLLPADFAPWIDASEAQRAGSTPEQHASTVAQRWRQGLAEWGQSGERIARLRAAADVAIYTPGSRAGLPLQVLRTFQAPPPVIVDDADAFTERVTASVSGLLALIGVNADPVRSREYILLSNIVDRAWRDGRDLELADLIREIQQPPFRRIGVLDLDAFFPPGDRFGLAMSLNGLLASPAFAQWLEGEPLDIQRLLWTESGKPRISILSIAHLPDPQRMFFVTTLLNELVTWMRRQPGTSSLRALLYMDEVFGYFPPVANPPSKLPMLTLLKQARAYGLGCVLATQNPVDLDYKGLSNMGTWFLGRLQTERDKARVLDGLEGAAIAAGTGFDRARLDTLLSGLKGRVFLMNNVHDAEPVLFHTRWAMSYLRGPLTRAQIEQLMSGRARPATVAPTPEARPARTASASTPAALAAPAAPHPAAEPEPRPILPDDIVERFARVQKTCPRGERLVYRPALVGRGRMHFVSSRDKVDSWQDFALRQVLEDEVSSDPWREPEALPAGKLEFEREPEPDARFAELPRALTKKGTFAKWAKKLEAWLYRNREVTVWTCKLLKQGSEPGESEGDFRARLRHELREHRDLAVEKLRKRYAPKLARMQERIRGAEQRVDREQSQVKQQGFQTAISVGSTLLGALFGRKVASVGNVGRAASAMRGAGRISREKADVARAKETLGSLQQALSELEAEFTEATAEIEDSLDVDSLELDSKDLSPRKADTDVAELALVWLPHAVGADGIAEPLT